MHSCVHFHTTVCSVNALLFCWRWLMIEAALCVTSCSTVIIGVKCHFLGHTFLPFVCVLSSTVLQWLNTVSLALGLCHFLSERKCFYFVYLFFRFDLKQTVSCGERLLFSREAAVSLASVATFFVEQSQRLNWILTESLQRVEG